MTEEKNWYVVYTRPRWEKKVAEKLMAAGVENYCPLNRVTRQWSDRKKVIREPLFKGYVFVRLPETAKWDVKQFDGVLNFVYWLGKPARVRESEIETIRKFLREFSDVEVSNGNFAVNDKVFVKQGVLMNYEGIVLEVAGNRAKVFINSMDITLSATFLKADLSKAIGG